MAINIDIDNFELDKLNPEILNVMNYLNYYLENNWNIQKTKNSYIVKKKDSKIYILLNSTFIDINHDDISDRNKYISCFLFNTLNNGWKIKKNKNEYIFIKKHEGKKEYIKQKYLHTFMKDNFKFN